MTEYVSTGCCNFNNVNLHQVVIVFKGTDDDETETMTALR